MEHVFVSQNSTLKVDCAADSSDVLARFIIDIPGVANDLQFIEGSIQMSILEQHGLFQLESDGVSQSMKTLLINNTMGINQTVIKCNFFGTGQTYQFTLFTYGMCAACAVNYSRGDIAHVWFTPQSQGQSCWRMIQKLTA